MDFGGVIGVFVFMVRVRIKRLLRLKVVIFEFKGRGIGKVSMFFCIRVLLFGYREVGDGYLKIEDLEFII